MSLSSPLILSTQPCVDSRVRKALNLAINRQNILDSVYYGTGTKAYTLLPPTSWAHQKDNVQVRYDRNYAIALLKEAGVEPGLELSMWVPQSQERTIQVRARPLSLSKLT